MQSLSVAAMTAIALVVVPITAHATDYYVAANGDDANAGNSQSAPWKTIDKVNAMSAAIQPGDSVLFRRGDSFYGAITVSESGAAGLPVTFGAYGVGNKPVISGFHSVGSWTKIAPNVWESTDPVSTLPTAAIVLINGVDVPMGRFPNGSATYPFLNYLPIDSHSGTTSITSAALAGTPNWTGADIVVRINSWTLDKGTVLSESGNTLAYAGIPEAPRDGWGFFVQNHPSTLDSDGEWYFDPSTKKLQVYGSAAPSNVQVASIDTLMTATHQKYLTVEDLRFEGANKNAFYAATAPYATVSGCEVAFAGAVGIYVDNASTDAVIENDNIADCGEYGILNAGINATIRDNQVRRTGLVSAIMPHDYDGAGVESYAANTLIQYNDIDESAYNGIFFRGAAVQVRNNFVDHSAMVRDDSGGIYTGFIGEAGKVIDGNIVLDTVGNMNGKAATEGLAGNCIYLDDLGNHITVTNNTVANCASAGIFMHISNTNTLMNNTSYNNGGTGWTTGQLMVQSGSTAKEIGYVRDNVVENNIFFARTPEQVAVFYYASDPSNVVTNFGTLDANYYAKPIGASDAFRVDQPPNGQVALDLSGWQSLSGQDSSSKGAPKAIANVDELRFEYNATKIDRAVTLDQTYIDVSGTAYCGTISIAPYRSLVLMKSDVPCTPAIPDAGAEAGDAGNGGDAGTGRTEEELTELTPRAAHARRKARLAATRAVSNWACSPRSPGRGAVAAPRAETLFCRWS